jgi:hypothetical protein
MAVFDVVENIWTHDVTVKACLCNAVFIPEIEHLLDLAEYAIVAVEDIGRVYTYYCVESSCLPPSQPPPLPASLMLGQGLDIDVTASRLCVMFSGKSELRSRRAICESAYYRVSERGV